MEMNKLTSPMPVAPRQINQAQGASAVRSANPSSSASASTSEPYLEYKVRVPRHLAKNYYMMRFQSCRPDLSSITKASMSRDSVSHVDKEEEVLPKSGAGSEYGRERREEARKRRRGYVKKAADPDGVPWNLKIGGKGGKRYSGRKEAGINDNSSYYILTQCPDGAFEAVPVTSWYNFTPNINYRTLTSDEAEEEFLRRDKTVNFFTLMVKKRLQANEEGEEQEKEKSSVKSRSMKLYDGDDDLELSDDDNDDDDEPGQDSKSKAKTDKSTKQTKGKSKAKGKAKKGSDEESDASSEEDGYFDSKEVDYMSDSSSSSEEEQKEDTNKPDTKDDLNAESTDSESDDDELTNAGKDIKKMLQKDQGEGGSSEDDDEDPENDDEVKGTAAMLFQDKGKVKKKPGSRSSTSSSSRSSTPTKATENQTATPTVQAVAKRLEGRPGTPTGKGKKRPASEPAKTGFVSISDSPSAKKARVSPSPSSQAGSTSNTPTPGDNGNTITEESVCRYLARKPMTTKDLLQKFKSKKTGLTNEQTVQKIAAILKKIQPEQNKIKGKLYLSLKST